MSAFLPFNGGNFIGHKLKGPENLTSYLFLSYSCPLCQSCVGLLTPRSLAETGIILTLITFSRFCRVFLPRASESREEAGDGLSSAQRPPPEGTGTSPQASSVPAHLTAAGGELVLPAAECRVPSMLSALGTHSGKLSELEAPTCFCAAHVSVCGSSPCLRCDSCGDCFQNAMSATPGPAPGLSVLNEWQALLLQHFHLGSVCRKA